MSAPMSKLTANCGRIQCGHGFSCRSRMLTPNYLLRKLSSKRKSENSITYCIDLVKKYDFENYLCALLYPDDIRTSAFAIRAYNVEVAQVSESVTDTMRGLGRMQFWKDAVEQIYKDSPPQTPVALQLAKAVKKHNLTKRWLLRMLEARVANLDCHFESLQAAENYSEDTSSSILYLLLEAQDIKDVQVDHAASHLGRCQGIVTLLRGTPYNAKKGHLFFPMESLVKHSVSQQDILHGKNMQAVCDITYDIASVAKQHLDTARSLKKDVPKKAMPLFLPSLICDKYLQNLQSVDFNVFDTSLQKRNGWLPLQLWIQNWRRTY